jgi:hypothetical protein
MSFVVKSDGRLDFSFLNLPVSTTVCFTQRQIEIQPIQIQI